MKRGRRSRRSGPKLLGAFAGLFVLALAFWLAGRAAARLGPAAPRVGRAPAIPAVAPAVEPRPLPPPASAQPVAPRVAAAPAPAPRPQRRSGPARIAIVIDDLGRSLAEIDRLDRLGIPVGYAVLPYEPRTPDVVAKLRARRAEILCHLPMEAREGEDPGPGALSAGLPPRRIRRLTEAALDAVPGAAGVNNHMGSRVTADPDAMREVLEVVRKRRLFFLDSRTTAESVGHAMALASGVPAARRTVFLDAEPGVEPVAEAFSALVAAARRDGAAIGIGHPRRTTFELLEREVPAARAAGVEFVPVSYLLERNEGLPE